MMFGPDSWLCHKGVRGVMWVDVGEGGAVGEGIGGLYREGI